MKIAFRAQTAVAQTEQRASTEEMSEEELRRYRQRAEVIRGRLSDFSGEFTRIVAPSASKMLREFQGEPMIASRCLYFVSGTVPYVNSLQFEPNPFVAIVDLVSFTQSLENFFVKGAGKEHFGRLQPVAKETAKKVNRIAWSYLKESFSPEEYAQIRQEIFRSVAKTPLKALFSVSDVKGRSAERMRVLSKESSGSVFMSGMSDSINDTARRLESLDLQIQRLNSTLEMMPLLARLQATLFVYRWIQQPEVNEAVADIKPALSSFARLHQVLETLPPERINQLIDNADQGRIGLQKLGRLSDELVDLIQTVRKLFFIAILAVLALVLALTYAVVRSLNVRARHAPA